MAAETRDTGLHDFIERLFGCSKEVAASVARCANDRIYRVRTVIVRQGDLSGVTFLLVAGRAHALTHGSEGQFVLLHEYLPGDFFGTIAAAEPAAEEADVVAMEDVRAAVFRAADFLAMIESHGGLAVVVSRALLRQLRAASTRVMERTTLSAAGRTHSELLRLARLGDGRTLRPAPVLSALALRVHSTRETVSRTINALERRGIIRREGDTLTIVAPHRLEELIV
jgi:CRP-like cAMP-binding protein